MADSKWSAHLDKLAYGLAGLIGIGLLVLPFVMGGNITAASEEAKEQTQKLKVKIDTQRNPALSRPGTAEKIEAQWTPGSANPRNPRWIHQVAPVLIRKISAGSTEPALHAAPQLTEVTCQRDETARKVTLFVRGNLSGENENVIVSGVELWRQAGAGVFEKIHSEQLDTDVFEYIDTEVASGETYTYRLVSIASKDPEAPEHIAPPQSGRMSSNEIGPTPPVPFDVSARIYSIMGEPGKNLSVMAKVEYWDYEAGELKGDKRPKVRKERERFEDGRFEFFPIDPLNRRCRLRDYKTRAQYPYKQGDKEVPVAPFESMYGDEGGDEDEEGEDEEGEEEDVEEDDSEEEEADEPEAPSRGRNF